MKEAMKESTKNCHAHLYFFIAEREKKADFFSQRMPNKCYFRFVKGEQSNMCDTTTKSAYITRFKIFKLKFIFIIILFGRWAAGAVVVVAVAVVDVTLYEFSM